MLDKKQQAAVVGRVTTKCTKVRVKMRLQDSHLTWPLQRLLAMLKDCQAQEKEPLKILMLGASADEAADIGPMERDRVVAWMALLNARFGFHPETFFLGAHCLDRFLSSIKSRSRYLECIALTCLYIASKIMEEEEVVPCTAQLIEGSDSGCRPKDVFRMERIILTKLDWSIMTPTAFTYLQIFYWLAFTHHLGHDSAEVMSVSALQTPTFSSLNFNMLTAQLQKVVCRYNVAIFPSSVISLALLSLEIESLNGASRSRSTVVRLQEFAKIRTEHLIECRKALTSLLPKHVYNPRFNNTVYLVTKPTCTSSCIKSVQLGAPPISSQGVATKRKNEDSSSASVRLDQFKKIHPLPLDGMDTNISNSLSPIMDNCQQKGKRRACKILPALAHSISDPPLIHNIDTSASLANVSKSTSDGNAGLLPVSVVSLSSLREDGTCEETSESWMPLPSLQPVAADLAGGECGLMQMEQEGYWLKYHKTTTSEDEDDCMWNQHGMTHGRPLTYAEIVKCGIVDSDESNIQMAHITGTDF